MRRTNWNHSYRLIGALGVVLALVLVAMPAGAEKMKPIEHYKGNVMVTASPGAGGSGMADFMTYRWSEESERQEILDAIKDATGKARPAREVAKALRGQKKAGYVSMANRIGYPIRYTKAFDMADGSRQIIMATDRPVSFSEAYSDSMAKDFDVTIIILKFDKDGKGSGLVSVGTELVWNEAEGKIGVTNASSQPVKVGDVRPAK